MKLDDVLDDPKLLTRYRVLRSTRPLLAERGLAVSMDDIAEAAGVSRRSLFRHFESRNALIAATLESSLEEFYGVLNEALAADGEFRDWLTALTQRLFAAQSGAGVAFWQLAAATDNELPPELAAVNKRRRKNRQQLTEAVADIAWRRAGGRSPCPSVLADTFALTMSTFTGQSLVTDYELSLDRTVELAVTVVTAVINNELAKPRTHRRRTTTKVG